MHAISEHLHKKKESRERTPTSCALPTHTFFTSTDTTFGTEIAATSSSDTQTMTSAVKLTAGSRRSAGENLRTDCT